MAPFADTADGSPRARAEVGHADASSHAPDAHAATHGPVVTLAAALDADPLSSALHAALAEALHEAGDENSALAHRIAVETFNTIASATESEALAGVSSPLLTALPLYNLATAYFMRGNHEAAVRWYQHTVAIAPDLAMAHQNMAAVLELLGRQTEAHEHRDRAYQLQRVFVEPCDAPTRRVLILCAGRGSGNVPFETLLPGPTSYRIKYAIDYAADAEDFQLPPHDLVFNAIGDPDIAQPLTQRLAGFVQRCGRPLLNRPDAVMRTQRHLLPQLFAGLDDVLTAPCMRLDATPASSDALFEQIVQGRIGFPLLLRPLATHGGDGLTLHESLDTLWPAVQALNAPCYLTMFRNYRSADGHFRKYRSVFVDRVPLPYHLAISPQWMVHYFSADMLAHPWKLDEERLFLEDPRAALGARAADALVAIGQRLDLDYGGVDYTVLPDGRVLVFEANATMLVHREAVDGVLAHKNGFVERIVDAFEQMQVARCGK
ncbi:hypothetical protein GCM10027093_46810 [Paraburkholderia jirisanensis]